VKKKITPMDRAVEGDDVMDFRQAQAELSEARRRVGDLERSLKAAHARIRLLEQRAAAAELSAAHAWKCAAER